MLNKTVLPNVIAVAVIVLSYALPEAAARIVRTAGLFALSGAITNWLAVHMLFERVPGLYGSGIVELHFEKFKQGILNLVAEKLLSTEQIAKAFSGDTDATGGFDFDGAIDQLSLDGAWNNLMSVIRSSSFGNLIDMIGGEAALEPMKAAFTGKMRDFLKESTRSDRFQETVRKGFTSASGQDLFRDKVMRIVSNRLDSLSPAMVKQLVKDIMYEHLGWLVVWGAVFGGLLGLVSALVFA